MIGGAIAAPIGIFLQEFVVTPLLGELARGIWSTETLHDWFFIVALPGLFTQGLVREGAKFVPVVIYWLCLKREMNAKLGLVVGAMAGAGFGLLEAQWTLNYIFHLGWAWENIQEYGILMAFAGFWETFFIMGYNIAAGALAGWGLGRGYGWQFYLLAAVAYTILMYIPALGEGQLIKDFQVELVIAAWALLLTGIVLWLRSTGNNKDDEVKRKSAKGN
jgi:RsiW-degrading membrane proteinase PrsW (M82 family)